MKVQLRLNRCKMEVKCWQKAHKKDFMIKQRVAVKCLVRKGVALNDKG